jgi:putative transposase
MKQDKLKVNIGYKRRYSDSSTPSVAADNHLHKPFLLLYEPDKVWVAEITCSVLRV